jgi:hypothetical protein
MRYFLFVTLFIINTNSPLCCVYSSISIWPQNLSVISTTPTFIVTLRGFNYSDLIRLGKFMHLASKTDTVKFEIVDTVVGEYEFYQAILKPVNPLKNNTAYMMDFDSLLPEYAINKIYRSFLKDSNDTVYPWWFTSDSNFNKEPPPRVSLKFKKCFYVGKFTSCINLAGKFKLKSQQPESDSVIYKLTLTHKNTKRYAYITPNKNDGLLHIDYDMIGIEDFSSYEISVEALDKAGHLSLPSKTISFHTPYLRAIGLRITYICNGIF